MGRLLLDGNETTSFSCCGKFSAANTVPDSNCAKTALTVSLADAARIQKDLKISSLSRIEDGEDELGKE